MFRLYDKIKNNEVYIIAEMSANHAGKLEIALEIVCEAAKAGADCLKIQTYTADTMTLDCDNEYFKIKEGLWKGYNLYDLYKEASTPWEWHETIKKECEQLNIDFLSTAFDKTSVDFLENLGVEAFKIASFELVDIQLIEYAASKQKPMIISCGISNIDDIKDAVRACYKAGNEQIVLLKCCSEYPANPEDMHLGNITDMKEYFKLPIGLSDHSKGCHIATLATAMGAKVIEKHLCLSRKIKTADSKFSMEPKEFAKMVSEVKKAKTICKSSYKHTDGELKSRAFRRSLFAVKDIEKGEIITTDNVKAIRPNYGLKPKYLKDLLGRPARHGVKRGEPIGHSMFYWD